MSPMILLTSKTLFQRTIYIHRAQVTGEKKSLKLSQNNGSNTRARYFFSAKNTNIETKIKEKPTNIVWVVLVSHSIFFVRGIEISRLSIRKNIDYLDREYLCHKKRMYNRTEIFLNLYYMYSLNRAQLIGNITADPEIRALPSGQKVANFSIATNRRYTDNAWVHQDIPEYHTISCFGKLADIAEMYVKKWQKVYLEGRIQTRSWEDQSGQKKYKTEIVGEQLIMLTPKNSEWFGHSRDHEKWDNLEHPEPPSIHSTIPPQEEKISIEDVPF